MATVIVGQKLGGRYQILQQIGEGGFSVTFLAEDIQRPGNPKCVVKQFKPKATDPYTLQEARRLFNQEAEILENLGKHDQIPRLLAHFEENQEFYLVQEYIEGHDLSKELLPSKKLSEAYVFKLLQDILEVLIFVHQQGVIHRDIKPSNIIRRQDGKIVLIDFGAVKQISTQIVNSQGQKHKTVAIGTAGYMPSEQSNGHPDFRSDIYAVGIIGIQALTGIPPLQLSKDTNTGEIIWRNQAQVRQELADILDQMVRYDFRDRYQSAEEALQALRVLLPATLTTPQASKTSISGSTLTYQKIFTKKLLIGLPIVAALGTSIIFLPSKKPAENFLIYQNSALGIKMKYPQSWEKQEINNPITGEVVAFLSPTESSADKFQEKVTITVEDFSGTLNEYSDSSIQEIENQAAGKIENTSNRNFANKSGK
ncbi:serine/threonine-protein kinase [Fischerella sp. PCC 9605]|uniref:serine/threonine-protein kinase n=1 Tax=Fischerella sp. PCC 9605 TaxID=1173024 RepID=UPI0004B3A8DC